MKHIAYAVSVFILAGVVPAIAQQYPGATNLSRFPQAAPGDSVYDRARPEFEADGIIVGDFTLRPSVTVGAYYDDNIFAADTNEVGSLVGYVGPQITAETEQGDLTIRGSLGAGLTFYERDSNQNGEEADANVRGRYQLSPSDSVSAGLRFRRQVVNRDDEEEGGGSADPNLVHRIIGRADYSGEFRAITVDAKVRGVDSDFQRSVQQDRDRRVYDGSVRLGYRTSRFITAFVEPNAELWNFDANVDRNGFQRDAERYGARVGVVYELGDRISAEAALGAARWEFDDSAFSSEDIWSADGSLGWNVTPLTTITVGGSRDEEHTTRNNSSLKEVISVNAGAEHEFRRDIIGFVNVEFRTIDFNGDPREDDNARASVGGEYFLSSNFSLSGRYIFSERDSNINTQDFTRNIVWFALQSQF